MVIDQQKDGDRQIEIDKQKEGDRSIDIQNDIDR